LGEKLRLHHVSPIGPRQKLHWFTLDFMVDALFNNETVPHHWFAGMFTNA
jgi:hypothetical protein